MVGFIRSTARSIVRRVVTSFAVLFGSYDAEQTTDENRKHWANARERTPKQTNTPQTRKKLRERCRYEWENNCYMSGLVSTLAIDLIGYTGPNLQVLSEDAELNTYIESQWVKWSTSEAVNLPSKLRVLDETKRVEGEGFLLLTFDAYTESKTGISLNVVNISPARVCDGANWYSDSNEYRDILDDEGIKIGSRRVVNDDGVVVDGTTGRPIEFKVTPTVDDYNAFDKINNRPETVDARYMLQWFTPRRPGQFRGVCELSPALPLYAQLRRYGLATLSAAEIAAMFAGVMTTPVPPGEDPPQLATNLKIEIERGSLIALPEGSEPHQFKPEQPTQSYEMFENVILRQIGRTLNVPFGIVAGDSSKYNYSSARMDYGDYEEKGNHDKGQLNIRILNPVYYEFLLELATIDKRVKKGMKEGTLYHTWQYAKRPSADPVKDAEAEDKRLRNGTITYAEIYASRGLDYEEQWDQRAKENKKMQEKNLAFTDISGTMDVPVDDSGNKPDSTVKTDVPDSTVGTDSTDDSSSLTDAAQSADIQQTGLNGAQIASLESIAEKVAQGIYSKEAGVLLLRLAFPLADVTLLNQLVTELAKTKPTVPVTPEPVTAA